MRKVIFMCQSPEPLEKFWSFCLCAAGGSIVAAAVTGGWTLVAITLIAIGVLAWAFGYVAGKIDEKE